MFKLALVFFFSFNLKKSIFFKFCIFVNLLITLSIHNLQNVNQEHFSISK